MVYSLFIGRWQPFHEAHKALIQSVLDEGKSVLVAIRDTEIDEKNPYTTSEREEMIRKALPDQERVLIMVIPDIEEVCYGRDVGWGIRELKLSPELENISGTKIRNGNVDNGK